MKSFSLGHLGFEHLGGTGVSSKHPKNPFSRTRKGSLVTEEPVPNTWELDGIIRGCEQGEKN